MDSTRQARMEWLPSFGRPLRLLEPDMRQTLSQAGADPVFALHLALAASVSGVPGGSDGADALAWAASCILIWTQSGNNTKGRGERARPVPWVYSCAGTPAALAKRAAPR